MGKNSRLLLAAAAVLVAAALALSLTAGDDSADSGASSALTEPPTFTLASSSTSTTAAPTTTSTTTTIPPAEAQRLEWVEVIDGMTAEQIAAQLLVVGLTGTEVADRLRDTVGTPCVGGVFVTSSNRNWAPLESGAAAARAIQDINTTSEAVNCPTGIPLVSTDAEFGSVVRVPVDSPDAAPEWTNRYLTGSPYDVLIDLQATASAYAADIRDLGIEVNFGAVADVVTDPGNFMAGSGRTFGDDAGIVASLANAVVAGHCEAGVAATLKHFPNQGDTAEDPHAERSFAPSTDDAWRATGRLPYVDTTAPLVMTGHIFTEHDPQAPASMSSIVTTELLREDLDYTGVIITDDLSTMRGAIAVAADPAARAVLAIDAGADLALFVRDTDAAEVIAELTANIEADPDFADRAEAAVLHTAMLRSAIRGPEVPLCG